MSVDPSPEVLVLPSSPQAPALARDHASRLGQGWSTDLLDVVLLVVSEAVTNAVRYGQGHVELTVLVASDRVRIEVSDANPEPPRKRASRDGLADGGRGLYLIEALTHTWGTRPRADRRGKTVWLELMTPA
jgi:anti-sigma regulatory factor (Ser/Thr protein kinase)